MVYLAVAVNRKVRVRYKGTKVQRYLHDNYNSSSTVLQLLHTVQQQCYSFYITTVISNTQPESNTDCAFSNAMQCTKGHSNAPNPLACS